MDAAFQELALDTLVRLWQAQHDQGAVDSRDIYDHLINSGVRIPIGALDRLFLDLQRRYLIRAAGYTDPAGVRAHGALLIFWVSPSLVRARIAAIQK
jgi:hypothetical protein